jgi:hypothetical protein
MAGSHFDGEGDLTLNKHRSPLESLADMPSENT